MKLIAIHQLFTEVNQPGKQPGEEFDIGDKAEAVRLIAIGAARRPGEPAAASPDGGQQAIV